MYCIVFLAPNVVVANACICMLFDCVESATAVPVEGLKNYGSKQYNRRAESALIGIGFLYSINYFWGVNAPHTSPVQPVLN